MRWVLLALLAGCGTPSLRGDGGCADRIFDRACSTSADCALLNHQVDCCGSEVELGVSAYGLSAAQQAERSCVAAGPFCQCVAKQTVAEDGRTFPEATALKVRCIAGRCESFVSN